MSFYRRGRFTIQNHWAVLYINIRRIIQTWLRNWRFITNQTGRGVGKFCFLNSACEDNLACISRRCQNPCDDKVCASNAVCTATNHRAICSCEKGYEGHPTTQCTMVQSCTYNPDCDLHLSCRYGKCVDSCATDCKNSRKCKVTSHVPDCSD